MRDMTHAQRREFLGQARQALAEAIAALEVAEGDIDAAIGNDHNVMSSVAESLLHARRAVAKLGIVIKRVPCDGGTT